MKLASLNNDTKDGLLVVVSKDLKTCIDVPELAGTLQSALDHWAEVVRPLEIIYEKLNAGDLQRAQPFRERECLSPLPRAFQWLDGSAYLHHVKLARMSRGADLPKDLEEKPLMYQGGSDSFLAPWDDIDLINPKFNLDFEAEIAVITDDVPMHTCALEADKHIKLLMLANDLSYRGLIPDELAKGFGFLVSKPSTAFSPLAITPDELGADWQNAKVCLPLETSLNGKTFGRTEAGQDMAFSFSQLIAHAAQTRRLSAGTIIGSGTVSNEDPALGFSCLIEARMTEKLSQGKERTPFLKKGDEIRMEMRDRKGQSLFGSLRQRVCEHKLTRDEIPSIQAFE